MNSMNSSSDFISKWQEEEITFTSDEIDLDVFATVQSSSSLNSSNFTSDELEEDFFESFAWSSEFMLRYSPAVSIVYFIAYTVVFVIGVIGNSCVVAVVVRSPRMRTVTNYFIVNLALADILVLVFCLPATLLANLFIPWLLGLFMCKAVSYLQGVAVSASITTLMAVSFDRFLAICFPLKCQMTRKTAIRIIFIIWIFSLVIASPWLMYFTLQPIDSRLMTIEICNEVWPDESTGVAYFVLANLGLCYIIPLFVITACYMAIWLKVWKRSIPGSGEASDSKTGKSLNLQMELVMQRSKLKVAKMMIVVVVIFVISWLPLYCIFARVKLGGPFEVGSIEEKLYMTLAPVAQWLGASNSSINPVLYAFFNKKYRSGFAAIIKSRKCCGPIRYEHAASTYLRQGTINSRSTRRMTRSTRIDIADASPPPSLSVQADTHHPATSSHVSPLPPPPSSSSSLHQSKGDPISDEKVTATEPLTTSSAPLPPPPPPPPN